MITLDNIKEDGECIIVSVNLRGKMRNRLSDLGFLKGTPVRCIKKNKTISAFLIRETVTALHNDICAEISVSDISARKSAPPLKKHLT